MLHIQFMKLSILECHHKIKIPQVKMCRRCVLKKTKPVCWRALQCRCLLYKGLYSLTGDVHYLKVVDLVHSF